MHAGYQKNPTTYFSVIYRDISSTYLPWAFLLFICMRHRHAVTLVCTHKHRNCTQKTEILKETLGRQCTCKPDSPRTDTAVCLISGNSTSRWVRNTSSTGSFGIPVSVIWEKVVCEYFCVKSIWYETVHLHTTLLFNAQTQKMASKMNHTTLTK